MCIIAFYCGFVKFADLLEIMNNAIVQLAWYQARLNIKYHTDPNVYYNMILMLWENCKHSFSTGNFAQRV